MSTHGNQHGHPRPQQAPLSRPNSSNVHGHPNPPNQPGTIVVSAQPNPHRPPVNFQTNPYVMYPAQQPHTVVHAHPAPNQHGHDTHQAPQPR